MISASAIRAYPTPAAVTAALERIIKETDPVRLHGYTSAQGDTAVRAKIAGSIEEAVRLSRK